MEKTQLQKANEHELKKLQEKYEKLRSIITAEGFCQEWYKLIPKYKNGTDAFHALNQFYFDNVKPQTYRYSNYNAFLNYVRSRKK